jgi:hypothetical protein
VIGAAIERWNRFWFAPGSAFRLAVCRMLFFGSLFLWQWPHDFSPWGRYSPVFWMPVPLFGVLGVPAFSPQTIAWMQLAWKTALLLSAMGLVTRAAMPVAFVLGTYLLGLPHNFGQTQHFDTLVIFATGALALSRAGDAWSIDALLAGRGGIRAPADGSEYTWPIRFVQVAMAAIFFAAGISKLRHSGVEWIFSDNLALLLRRQQYHISDGEPLTRWGIAVARHAWMARGLALASVSIEILFPLALVSAHARAVLVPAGLAMLVGIRALMGPTFEQFMLCYVFWVPWGDGALLNAWRRTSAAFSALTSVAARRHQAPARTNATASKPSPPASAGTPNSHSTNATSRPPCHSMSRGDVAVPS